MEQGAAVRALMSSQRARHTVKAAEGEDGQGSSSEAAAHLAQATALAAGAMGKYSLARWAWQDACVLRSRNLKCSTAFSCCLLHARLVMLVVYMHTHTHTHTHMHTHTCTHQYHAGCLQEPGCTCEVAVVQD